MRSFFLAIGTLALLSTSGCSAGIAPYKGPIEQLVQGTTDTRVGIQTLATGVNDLALHNRAWVAASKSARFGDAEMAPLVPPEYVQARVAGLLMIERFATQMLRVVDSDAGTLASRQVVDLATDVGVFAGTLGSGAAKDYAAPVGGLAKVIIDLYDGSTREVILDKGIHAGVPAAKQVLALLKLDFKPGSPRNLGQLKKEELKTLKSEQLRAYDLMLESEGSLTATEKMSTSRTQARYVAIQKIIDTQQLIDLAADDQVYLTLVSLDESLDALIAATGKGPANAETLRALVDQLATFSVNAVRLLNSVTAFRSATSASSSK